MSDEIADCERTYAELEAAYLQACRERDALRRVVDQAQMFAAQRVKETLYSSPWQGLLGILGLAPPPFTTDGGEAWGQFLEQSP